MLLTEERGSPELAKFSYHNDFTGVGQTNILIL